jgi:hypothetical protein
MDVTPYVDRLRAELGAVAEAGGPEVRAAADRIATALDPAVRMTLLEALSQAAAEISTLVPSGSVDVRLRGRDVDFVVDVPPPPTFTAGPAGGSPPRDGQDAEGVGSAQDGLGEDDDVVRITVRIPESVKLKAEELAARSGRSLNAWIVTALRAAVKDRPGSRSGPRVEVDIDLGSLGRWTDGRGPHGKQMSGWV